MRKPIFENGVKKGLWNAEEDRRLAATLDFLIRKSILNWNWSEIPKYAGLLRNGKSCRLRWVNYLGSVKRGNITKDEEDTIIRLHNAWGNKWSAIALVLGRTDNEVKNYYHGHLKKRIVDSDPADPNKSKTEEIINASISSNPVKQGNITKEEEDTIIHLYKAWGNKWSAIALGVGRTENEVKNYYLGLLIKKRIVDPADLDKSKTKKTDAPISSNPEESCTTSVDSIASSSIGTTSSVSKEEQKNEGNSIIKETWWDGLSSIEDLSGCEEPSSPCTLYMHEYAFNMFEQLNADGIIIGYPNTCVM